MKKFIGLFLIFAAMAAAMYSVSVCAEYEIQAPGGIVTDADSFISALGGEGAAQLIDGRITLMSDILLNGTIMIEAGEYVVNGAGCYLTRGDIIAGEPMISVGATLDFGHSKIASDTDAIVLDGLNKEYGGPLIKVKENGVLNIYKGTVLRNSSTDSDGAGIYNSGTVNFYDGKLENCVASENGGGICNSGVLNLLSGTITGCSARKGGGLYNEGLISIIAFNITSNSAMYGGGIYSVSDTSLTGGNIDKNTAVICGGGISNAGTLSLKEVSIAENSASYGGGLYNSGVCTLNGARLSENTAENGGNIYNGGAIMSENDGYEFKGGTLNIESGYIYNGVSKVKGGGLYNEADSETVLSGGSFSGSESVLGGGIYNNGTLKISGGGINSSKAEYGKAIFNLGTLIFSKSAYISKENDIFIPCSDDNAYAIKLASALTPELSAVLTPGVSDGDGWKYNYVAGTVMIVNAPDAEDDFLSSEYFRFKLTDNGEYDKKAKEKWKVNAVGALVKAQEFYETWWFWTIIAAGFLAVTAAVVIPLGLKKRRTEAVSDSTTPNQTGTSESPDKTDSSGS